MAPLQDGRSPKLTDQPLLLAHIPICQQPSQMSRECGSPRKDLLRVQLVVHLILKHIHLPLIVMKVVSISTTCVRYRQRLNKSQDRSFRSTDLRLPLLITKGFDLDC